MLKMYLTRKFINYIMINLYVTIFFYKLGFGYFIKRVFDSHCIYKNVTFYYMFVFKITANIGKTEELYVQHCTLKTIIIMNSNITIIIIINLYYLLVRLYFICFLYKYKLMNDNLFCHKGNKLNIAMPRVILSVIL